MKYLLALFLCLTLPIWGGVRAYQAIDFNREVTGHLKRAADANTTELARKELTVAVTYLERNRLTSGYTSIVYQTPDEDVEFWYTNLKASLDELEKVPDTASQLERSNMLMKLRETLLDQGDKGASVTSPDGISVYPANGMFALWGWIGTLLFVAGFIVFKDALDEY